AYGFYKPLTLIWSFARPHLMMPSYGKRLASSHVSLPMRCVATGIGALLAVTVLLAPAIPLSNYNLFISRISGLSYHEHFADYDDVGNYMRGRLRPGDLVISLSPSISVQYYVGRVDHYFSVDRALFLIEKDGALLETSSGAHPFLNQADFQAVLSQYSRVW